MYEDAYATLGLKGGADDQEVRRAFRRLALLTHPDYDGSAGAADRMRALVKAREALIRRFEGRVAVAFEDFLRSLCPDGEGGLDEGVALQLARLINQDDDASVYIRCDKAEAAR